MHTLVLLSSALLAGPAALAQAAPSTPGWTTEGTLLEVRATGRVTRVPDLAVIHAGVITQASDASGALSANSARMARVLSALRAAGIADRDLSTASVELQPQYRYQEGKPPEITGYQASNRLTVRFRDIARAGRVLDVLVAQGANQIDGPSLTLDHPEAALDEARVDAVTRARARAELYARAAGLHVERILVMSEDGENGGSPPVLYRSRAVAGVAEPTQVVPGETEVTATLSIKFLLK